MNHLNLILLTLFALAILYALASEHSNRRFAQKRKTRANAERQVSELESVERRALIVARADVAEYGDANPIL